MNAQNVKALISLCDSYVKKFNIDIKQPPITISETTNTIEVDYNVSDINYDDNQLFGRVELILKIELSNESNIPFVNCDLEYLGLFNADVNSISKEDFIKMLELNGVMVLYQMARPLITSISAQAGITPPITIPLINVYKLVKNKPTVQQINDNKNVISEGKTDDEKTD